MDDGLRERLSAGEERGLLSLSVQGDAIRWAELQEELRRTHFVAENATLQRLVRDLVAMEPNGILGLASPYSISDGTIEGRAVGQVLATLQALAEVFSPDAGSPLAKPRREVGRSHAR